MYIRMCIYMYVCMHACLCVCVCVCVCVDQWVNAAILPHCRTFGGGTDLSCRSSAEVNNEQSFRLTSNAL